MDRVFDYIYTHPFEFTVAGGILFVAFCSAIIARPVESVRGMPFGWVIYGIFRDMLIAIMPIVQHRLPQNVQQTIITDQNVVVNPQAKKEEKNP